MAAEQHHVIAAAAAAAAAGCPHRLQADGALPPLLMLRQRPRTRAGARVVNLPAPPAELELAPPLPQLIPPLDAPLPDATLSDVSRPESTSVATSQPVDTLLDSTWLDNLSAANSSVGEQWDACWLVIYPDPVHLGATYVDAGCATAHDDAG